MFTKYYWTMYINVKFLFIGHSANSGLNWTRVPFACGEVTNFNPVSQKGAHQDPSRLKGHKHKVCIGKNLTAFTGIW